MALNIYNINYSDVEIKFNCILYLFFMVLPKNTFLQFQSHRPLENAKFNYMIFFLFRAPSFFCENETRHGLTLHYRTRRKGFVRNSIC